jgi:hypothetical protein
VRDVPRTGEVGWAPYPQQRHGAHGLVVGTFPTPISWWGGRWQAEQQVHGTEIGIVGAHITADGAWHRRRQDRHKRATGQVRNTVADARRAWISIPPLRHGHALAGAAYDALGLRRVLVIEDFVRDVCLIASRVLSHLASLRHPVMLLVPVVRE